MSSGLLTVVVFLGFIWVLMALKGKKKTPEERTGQKALGWGLAGGVIGSFFGIAGFGGAISGAIPGAILGFFLGITFLSKK